VRFFLIQKNYYRIFEMLDITALDSVVMQQIPIQCDIYDVSQENWDSLIDDMVARIKRK